MFNIDYMPRLEEWIVGHKSRWLRIFHDNGYGASCWDIEMGDSWHLLYLDESILMDKFDLDDWPGLASLVGYALREWEKGENSEYIRVPGSKNREGGEAPKC